MNTRLAAWAPVLAMSLAGPACENLPNETLKISPDTVAHRQLQTRRFDGADEAKILSASAGVLQDLGFNLDDSETHLGLIVASKNRSARSPGQVAGAVVAALLGIYTTIDESQLIRVSLVARPADTEVGSPIVNDMLVRVTFQRVVSDTQGRVTRAETIDDPAIYREFFDRLSQSLFLTANQI